MQRIARGGQQRVGGRQAAFEPLGALPIAPQQIRQGSDAYPESHASSDYERADAAASRGQPALAAWRRNERTTRRWKGAIAAM